MEIVQKTMEEITRAKGRTVGGLCRYTLEILRNVYFQNFQDSLADLTFAMDSFRGCQDFKNFLVLKREMERMEKNFSIFSSIETHTK